MIDKLKSLINITSALEEEVENLSESTQKTTETNNYVCFNKNLINYSILTKQKVLVAQFEVTQGLNLYFQALVEINLSSSQKITFSLLANNISIYKSTKSLSVGFNQITLMKSFVPLENGIVEVYLEITPNDQKQVLLENVSLSVWGLTQLNNNIKYQILELDDVFLLSFLNNNRIYLIETPKVSSTNNVEDFEFFKSSKDYSFVYNETSKILYLFRIDTTGKLFYSNFDDKNEQYVLSDANSVSATSNGEIILLTFIKNKICYYTEFKDGVFSNIKQIICSNKNLCSVYCFYNNFSEKFYVIMSDENGSNYLVESSNEACVHGDNIASTVSISISTYTGGML